LLTNHSRYEKRNDISHSLSYRRADAGFLLKHAGDHYYYNASNHSYGSAATARTNDDYNDAHGRRLLTGLLLATALRTVCFQIREQRLDRPQLGD